MLQERLKCAETTLGELQNLQSEMRTSHTERLQELHHLVQDLGQVKEEEAELETQPVFLGDCKKEKSTPLRPDASVFIPLRCVEEPNDAVEGKAEADTVGDGTTRRPMHRPAVYDGKSQWEAYSTQFEMLASLNHWTEAEKATYLAVSLRGSALTVLTNLSEGQRSSYPALTAALKNRYGAGHQTELNRAKLRGRLRRRDETLPALAEDVERLT